MGHSGDPFLGGEPFHQSLWVRFVCHGTGVLSFVYPTVRPTIPTLFVRQMCRSCLDLVGPTDVQIMSDGPTRSRDPFWTSAQLAK